jgi:hypothetical protein
MSNCRDIFAEVMEGMDHLLATKEEPAENQPDRQEDEEDGEWPPEKKEK